MPQLDNKFSAIWYDTSTWPWTPLTGLSATITIRRKDTNVIVVDEEPMTHIWLWEYDYVYEDMDVSLAYSYVMNPNSTTALVQTWFVDPRIAYLNKSVSEIAVGWNPYISAMPWIQGGIEAINKKIESKWEEVIEVVKGIKIPEQKEPVVNVTTEKIDTEWFIKAIKEIKPEVNITTETVNVDFQPVMDKIWEIGKISDIKIPEQKETDMSWVEKAINTLSTNIEDTKEDIIEVIEWKKTIYQAVWELFENAVNKKEWKEKEMEEEDNLKRPFPSSFTATLN